MGKLRTSIKAVLTMADWGNWDYELRYKDPEYEVYSYEIGDGIWGSRFEDLEEIAQKLGQKVLDDWLKINPGAEEDGLLTKELELEVPFSYVEEEGYSIIRKKGGKIVKTSLRDMEHMCLDGCINLPDGRVVEPDSEDSPLYEMGLI